MTDEELIARLQDEQPVTQDFQSTMKCELMDAAAKRIEELIKKNNNLIELAMDEHKRAETAEYKLTKALAALDEAIYLLNPDEDDMAKKAGVYRIVTTYKELKGET